MKSTPASLLMMVAVVASLSGCDWIKSLWTSDEKAQPAAAATAPPPAPAAGRSEMAKPGSAAPEASRPDEDAALAEKVKSALAEDPDLKRLAIDARASEGVVTLYGTANTLANREKAARVASGVAGVKSVKNGVVIVAGS